MSVPVFPGPGVIPGDDPLGTIQSAGPFQSAALPFSPVDLSPPFRPIRQAGGIDVVNNLLLTLFAASAAVVMREPLIHTLPQQPAPFEYRVPNLLTSTLAPVTPGLQMPSTPLDQGVWAPNTWRADEVRLNLLETTLRPTTAPFRPIDFPSPAAAPVVPSWQPQRNLPLTAVPFRPVDTTPPPVLRGQLSFDPPNLLTSTLTPQQQATPFTPPDFSALPKVVGPQDYRPADLLTSVLLGQTQPFNQLSWPPLPATRLLPEYPAGENIALATTPAPQPFNQLDWPPLPKTVSPEPHLIPNTTIRQVAPVAPPNLHKLYYDVSSGRLFWRVSTTANPIEIIPL